MCAFWAGCAECARDVQCKNQFFGLRLFVSGKMIPFNSRTKQLQALARWRGAESLNSMAKSQLCKQHFFAVFMNLCAFSSLPKRHPYSSKRLNL